MSNVRREILERAYAVAPQAVYGSDLIDQTRHSAGAVYTSLNVLESAGLLRSRLEQGSAELLGRPLRRLYEISGLGVELVQASEAKGWTPAVWRAVVLGGV